MTENKTLANGASLSHETFADFVERLRHDCVGKGVEDHYTADAIFIVQARRMIFGIDRHYTDKVAVIVDEQNWMSPQAYWDDLEEEERTALDAAAEENHGHLFLECHEYEQWDILAELDEHTVTGWDERWEYINTHFTKEAAEAFIRRKAHDYRDGLRVYVDAQSYCWEFNAIKQALMDGRLLLSDPKGDGQ